MQRTEEQSTGAALDLRVILATLRSGPAMGQQSYEAHLARALAAARPAWDVRKVAVTPLRSPVPGGRPLPLRLVGALPWRAQHLLGTWVYGSADLVHRQDLRIPPPRGPEVLTVHDLAPLHFQDEGMLPPHWRTHIKRATRVVTASFTIAEEIADACDVPLPDVIPHGWDPALVSVPAADRAQLASMGIDRPYVLHLGGATRRKNLSALAEAWKLITSEEPDVMLVLCGPSHESRDALFAGTDRCILTGHLPRAQVIGLLRSALALVVPSIYEGFGLPAIEAMAAGVPVVAARRSSLPEVCGGDAIFVEPDGEGLAAGIGRVMHGSDIGAMVDRGRLRAADATWQSAAEAYCRLYEAALT